MIKSKSIKDYVCPNCFRRPNLCKCKYYTNFLILIDFNLQEIIQKLNDKGIKTCDCCEGHFGDSKANIYISFYNPVQSCPKDFKIENKKIIRHLYKAKSKNEFEKEKERMIQNLNNWIDGIE